MKKIIFISMLVVSLLSARQVFPETDKVISVKANSYNILNIDNNTNENIFYNAYFFYIYIVFSHVISPFLLKEI